MDFSAIRETLPNVVGTPKKVCVVCQEPADKQCAACQGVDYCSAEHQKSHWKTHKKACSPIRIVTSSELGPHFVATRYLPPWTLLLTELPVNVMPVLNYPASCVSCRSIIPGDPWPCLKCSTPFFCNLACSMNDIHSECEYLSKCNEEQRRKLYNSYLGYLRAIHLKDSDPETWAKVLEMRGANQLIPGETWTENDKWFIREILPLFGKKAVGFEADLAKLCGIYQERGFVVTPSPLARKKGENHGVSQLLYLKASNFAQNCFPNCTRIIGKGPQFQLQIRTIVEVKKGEIISIDFAGGTSYSVGAMERHHKRNITKRKTLCICPRCTDPTELGTMQSAVKCTECREGYLLPVDSLNMADDALWRCNLSGCKGKGKTWGEIEEITSKCKVDAFFFKGMFPVCDAERISEFLESLKKKLHPNHYLVKNFEFDTTCELNSQMMDFGMRFSLPRMDLHIEICEKLLKMLDLIQPNGISADRAFFLIQLFNGLNHRLLWQPEDRQRAWQKKLMKRAIEVINQLEPFEKFYPDIWTPNDVIYSTARREIFQMLLGSIN